MSKKFLSGLKMKMNLKWLLLFFLLFIFVSFSCKEDPPILPPPLDAKLTLTLEDVSCTEAWLNLKLENVKLPINLELKSNTTILKSYTAINSNDTVLYVDSLLPNQTYTLQASSNQYQVPSNELSLNTMDTTSHNFTWQTFEFGQHSSSAIYDVVIIDENNIWAVGEIYMDNSLGNPDPNAYNAVHWNGQEWELKKIGNQGGWACHTVIAFSATDVWFEGVIKWDGTNYTIHNNGFPKEPNGDGWRINKMWGVSSSDFYVVGNGGNIAHYNGSRWTKIESGTELNVYDIWGERKQNGEYEILCVASTLDVDRGKKIFQLIGLEAIEINSIGLPWSLISLWFVPERKYYIAGDGLHVIQNLSENWIRNNSMPPYYKSGIRGNGFNDIVITGAFGLLMHFNGISWYNFQNITYMNGSYGKLDIKGNTICTGGIKNSQAIITLGKR